MADLFAARVLLPNTILQFNMLVISNISRSKAFCFIAVSKSAFLEYLIKRSFCYCTKDSLECDLNLLQQM